MGKILAFREAYRLLWQINVDKNVDKKGTQPTKVRADELKHRDHKDLKIGEWRANLPCLNWCDIQWCGITGEPSGNKESM
jgi:hypothetical protein